MFERLSVTMVTNLPSCFIIQFLEQLKFLVNFTLLKYVKSQRSYGFLITKELIFGFQILDLKGHFSASLRKLTEVRANRVPRKINKNNRSRLSSSQQVIHASSATFQLLLWQQMTQGNCNVDPPAVPRESKEKSKRHTME